MGIKIVEKLGFIRSEKIINNKLTKTFIIESRLINVKVDKDDFM